MKRTQRKFFASHEDMNFYCFLPKNELINSIESTNCINIINTKEELIKFCDTYGVPVQPYQLDRLKNNSVLYALCSENAILCRGWISRQDYFYEYDSNSMLFTKDYIILYDFETDINYRSKGFYSQLLLAMINKNLNVNLPYLIFALKKNIPSNRAICKVGFTKINNVNKAVVFKLND